MLHLISSLTLVLAGAALWAAQLQTFGHVWLYVLLCASGALGVKLLLPYSWLLALGLVVWWRLQLGLGFVAAQTQWILVITSLACRDFSANHAQRHLSLRCFPC